MHIMANSSIVTKSDSVLITGSNGFIGCKVVETLLEDGFYNLKCFARPSGKLQRLNEALLRYPKAQVEIIKGNLLSPEDCARAASNVRLVYHLAAGFDKSFAGAFMNSVLTTRNLIDALIEQRAVKRFVNVSSFAVYSNRKLKRGALLDESCAVEDPPQGRCEAYAYGKRKQEQLVME